MLEQVPVGLRRHDAQIEAQAFVRQHGGLGRAFSHHFDHPLQLGEVVDQRPRILGGRDDVEVAKRLLAPPSAARLGHLHRRGVLLQHVDHGKKSAEPVAEQTAVRRLLLLLCQRLEDPLLRFGAEPGQSA